MMKVAETIFYFDVCPRVGWRYPEDYAFMAHVHDERQIECRLEIADTVGQMYASCIEAAGAAMNLRCPLAESTTWMTPGPTVTEHGAHSANKRLRYSV